MNLMATDNFHQSLPACLNTDESVREEIDKSLKDKLYSDTNVIFLIIGQIKELFILCQILNQQMIKQNLQMVISDTNFL